MIESTSMNAKLLCAVTLCGSLWAQAPAPPTIKLEDALERARKYAGQIQSANLALLQAKEDTVQTKAARLPSVNAFNQFIYTQPNGAPSGVFVSNDGVHIYNEQAQVHEELLAAVRQGEVKRALAAEMVLKAKTEIASRGLNATVIQDYYAILAAERRKANLQTSVGEAEHFLDITQKQAKAGEVARADVIKAQIDLRQRQRDLAEAQLAIGKAKMALGVLIFPDFSAEFLAVDDLQQPAELPPMADAHTNAMTSSPDLKAAEAGVKVAGLDVTVARYQYLPSLGLDFLYGLNSTELAYRIDGQRNLGYAAQATLNIPIWNWGSTRSKVKQAEMRREQAETDFSLAKRTLQGNVAAAYAEAQTAQGQLASLKTSVDLAAENLRLTLLRYQAGESIALEVVDSQNTATQARNAYDDGLVRYRVAQANLKILMGAF